MLPKDAMPTALIIQLNTPGGDLQSMDNIIQDIRASTVPVVVYVAPNSAMAGSAGALITISAACRGHGSRSGHRRIQPD